MKDLFGNIDEEGMYQMALNMPLAEKIEIALECIRTFGQNAIVRFSGGKDSIVLERLFRDSGVSYELRTSHTTMDAPELVRFIRDNYPQCVEVRPAKNMAMATVDHASGLHTRRGRWCCQQYKHSDVQDGRVKAVGVRASESPRRKGLWRTVTKFDGDTLLSPILYWTDADIWQFIRENEMKYCSLYDEGFKRLGCIGCALGGNNRIAEFKRWPKYEAMWKRGGKAWWEKYHDKLKLDGTRYFAAKFPTFELYWSWWMEEKNINDTDNADCQMFLW